MSKSKSQSRRQSAGRRSEWLARAPVFFLEAGEGMVELWRDILGILLLAFSLAGALALLGLSAGAWTETLAALLTTWLGWGAVLFPVSIGMLGLAMLAPSFGWWEHVRLSRVIAAELAAVLLLGLAHLGLASSLAQTNGIELPETLAGREIMLQVLSGQGGGKVGWAVVALTLRASFGSPMLVLGILFAMASSYAMGLNWQHLFEPFISLQRWLSVKDSADPDVSSSDVRRTVASRPRRKSQRVKYERRFVVEAYKDKPPPKARARTGQLPGLSLLSEGRSQKPSEKDINRNAVIIERTMAEFGVPATVIDFQAGPTVTQFAVQPGYTERADQDGETRRRKVRVSQISNLAGDLSLALRTGRIRIQAPVPGHSYVGVEVPNRKKAFVSLRGILESDVFYQVNAPLAFAMGRDVSGAPVVADLGSMPHLLIAGTTGSGKSVCIASLVTGLVMNNTPDDLRIVMVDPKRVELLRFNGLPHLLGPVEVELERIIGTLRWVLAEMGNRYRKFEEVSARDLSEYNRKIRRQRQPKHLPKIVVVIDELADLMMMAQDETEKTLIRLAQMARATGIHLVVATQRPSTDVVTGLIKANFPARVSFTVASSVDSRVVLDTVGAESLLGQGDMLYLAPEAASPSRLQGVFVTDKEVERVVSYWQRQSAEYQSDRDEMGDMQEDPDEKHAPWEELLVRRSVLEDKDGQFTQAIEIVRRHGTASASLLQRKLKIGYPRAARLMDELEEMGIVGEIRQGGKTREVLIGDGDDPIGTTTPIAYGAE